jgi:tetratricopeptide (TPR) repeat protein
LLLAACGLGGPASSSDSDSAPYGAILEGRGLLSSDKTAEAEAHFNALLIAHPGSLEASRGLQDARRELSPEAEFLAHYDQGVVAEPHSSLAYYLRGRSRIAAPPRAEADFRRAAELDPSNAWAAAGLAYLAYQRGDLFQTVQIYEEAIRRAPRSAQLRLLLGNQYLELKLYIDAQRQLEKAHSLAPQDLEVWAALGKVWLALGQESAALEILERTRAAEPRIAHIAPSLAAIYLRRGKPKAADEAYRAGLRAGLPADEDLADEIGAALVLERLDKE